MLLRIQRNGASSTTTTAETLDSYGLGGVHCDKCNDTGHIVSVRDGAIYSRECECMAKRRSIRNIQRSGLADVLYRYTFGTYKTPDAVSAKIKANAMEFASANTGWFYICGKPGTGKTHICTAICGELIKRGLETRYTVWRDEAVKLKAMITDTDYDAEILKLKKVPVLYVDDFLKGNASPADIALAFEILNARYNDSRKRTIISSELTIDQVCSIDMAVGSRIYERAKGYVWKSPDKNWRME